MIVMIITFVLVVAGLVLLSVYEERLQDMNQYEPEEFESEIRVRELRERIKHANRMISRQKVTTPHISVKKPRRLSPYARLNS
tara:strand:- start:960 stop:1208 length:249 start_codon:yes stop_codon:yes gene_type:complete